jgi:polyphosphate kinase
VSSSPVPAASVADDAPLPAGRFLDRELSWLAFNQRVLEMAADESMPLLERTKFLAILIYLNPVYKMLVSTCATIG